MVDDDNDDDDLSQRVEGQLAWAVGVSGAILSVAVVAHVLRAAGFAPEDA